MSDFERSYHVEEQRERIDVIDKHLTIEISNDPPKIAQKLEMPILENEIMRSKNPSYVKFSGKVAFFNEGNNEKKSAKTKKNSRRAVKKSSS